MLCALHLIFILVVMKMVTIGSAVESDEVIVNVPELGSLRGSIGKSAWSQKCIYQFRGIHFAESPSGQRRFKLPTPRQPWTGIKDVRENDIGCPVFSNLSKLSPEELQARDWEDCLHLSVYTKNISGNLPVMFYIHGGAFIFGDAASNSPNFLLEHDIILVVIQYRLGVLGFLATNSEAIPGNVALFDVILALEWVQTYIQHFGGDPNRVTIFGLSAGAIIASMLTISPKVRDGLFHQVIVQSGTAFLQWGSEQKPIETAREIAKKGGCEDVDDLDVLNKFFMEIPVEELMRITAGQLFRPTFGDLNDFVTDTAKKMWDETGRAYPTVGGIAKHEGTAHLALIYHFIGPLLEASTDALEIIETTAAFGGITDDSGYTNILTMSLLFTQEQLEHGTFRELLPGLIDMTNNNFMKIPMLRFLQLNAQRRPNETYLYTFDYAGEHTGFSAENVPFRGGVSHADENFYIFPTKPLNSKDTEVAKKIVSLWTSFAMTGIPRVDGEVSWPPMTGKTGPYFHIDEVCSVSDDFVKEFTVTIDDKTNSLIK